MIPNHTKAYFSHVTNRRTFLAYLHMYEYNSELAVCMRACDKYNMLHCELVKLFSKEVLFIVIAVLDSSSKCKVQGHSEFLEEVANSPWN